MVQGESGKRIKMRGANPSTVGVSQTLYGALHRVQALWHPCAKADHERNFVGEADFMRSNKLQHELFCKVRLQRHP